jgi:hypothetical protein
LPPRPLAVGTLKNPLPRNDPPRVLSFSRQTIDKLGNSRDLLGSNAKGNGLAFVYGGARSTHTGTLAGKPGTKFCIQGN